MAESNRPDSIRRKIVDAVIHELKQLTQQLNELRKVEGKPSKADVRTNSLEPTREELDAMEAFRPTFSEFVRALEAEVENCG